MFLTYSEFKKPFIAHEKLNKKSSFTTRVSCLTVQILTLSPSFFCGKGKKESPVIFGSLLRNQTMLLLSNFRTRWTAVSTTGESFVVDSFVFKCLLAQALFQWWLNNGSVVIFGSGLSTGVHPGVNSNGFCKIG